MDPLSITASAITLIQAAGAVKTSLQRLGHSLKTADSRIAGLCDELASLTSLLEAVERTMKGRRPLDSACVDDDLWHQSDLCLVDCQVTLNELAVLVHKIKQSAATRSFGWRLRAVADLSTYSPDIAMFRDKIHKSNWALQTVLHTITVSLSLRNNASQDMILFELDRLQASIDEALQASRRPPQGFSHGLPSDSRVARNLRNLAEAASHFHSAASSTAASTIRDRSAGSFLGDFPAYRRERVETFISSVPGHAANTGHETPVTHVSLLPPSVRSAPLSPPLANPRPLCVATSSPRWSFVEDDEDDEDDEAEFEKSFVDELGDLARDSIRLKQFEKAILLLTDAIQRREKAGAANDQVQRLQTQLALCHFFKDDWKQAEPIVSALARSVESLSSLGPVVWTMLHALALAYLSTYAFDDALTMCKKAMQAMRKWARRTRLDRRSVAGWADTTGLLATIFQMQGDYIAAEIYRRQLPEHFVYHHCSDPREFLSAQPDVLGWVLGDDLPDFCHQRPENFVNTLPGFHGFHESKESTQPCAEQASGQRHTAERRTRTVNGSGDVSPLRARRHEWEKFEMDTSKEVVVPTSSSAHETDGADDEATSTAPSSPHSPTGIDGIRRIMATSVLGTRLGWHRAPGGAETDSDPSAKTRLVQRWLKAGNIFSVKPSKAVLRKRPSNETNPLQIGKPRQTFRVKRVQLIGSSTAGPSRNGPTSRAYPERSLEDCSIPELSGEACAACPAPPSPAHEEADNRTVRTGIADTSPRCGRQSQTVTSQDDHSGMTVPEARATCLGNEDHSSGMSRTGAVNTDGGASQWDAVTEAAHLTVTPGLKETKKVITLLVPAGGRGMLRRPALLRPPPFTAALTQEQATTFTRLAGILISSAARKGWGADKLHGTKLELEALLTNLGRWSTDLTLHRDVQMVIEALRARATRLDQRQDSGYESMSHDNSSEENVPVDREGSGSEPAASGQSKPGRKGGLKRQLSWLAGDDAAYLASPGNLQSPLTPHTENCLLARSWKVVDGSPGKDPADAAVTRVEGTGETEGLEDDGCESTQG